MLISKGYTNGWLSALLVLLGKSSAYVSSLFHFIFPLWSAHTTVPTLHLLLSEFDPDALYSVVTLPE